MVIVYRILSEHRPRCTGKGEPMLDRPIPRTLADTTDSLSESDPTAVTELTVRDRDLFLKLLDNPDATPNAALADAASCYLRRQMFGGE